jgi:cation transport ATPase
MNNSLDDDLRNKKIEINKLETPLSSQENAPQPQKSLKINLVKNTYSNFVKNIKNLATKNVSQSQSGEVNISSSQNEPQDIAPKTWKDKLAIAIISKIEVEKNITVFLALLAMGSLLLCFSIFMIPFIITSPSKFSLCFAFGSSLVLISFLFYHGTKNYILKLFDKKRFTITALFICSILVGIIFSIGKHYFISLLCSLFQLLSLVLFVLTFIPGGRNGINCIKRQVTSPFVRVFMRMAENEINNS